MIGKGFAFGPLSSHRYIGNIVLSKIVRLGFCPIHFTVTFAETLNIHLYAGNIVIEDRYIGVPLYQLIVT